LPYLPGSSLIGDIGSTKEILGQLTSTSGSDAEEKLANVQTLLAKMEACDEYEQEAIQQIQEMWACHDVKSPTFQEDLEMTKAMLTSVEETAAEREQTAATIVEVTFYCVRFICRIFEPHQMVTTPILL